MTWDIISIKSEEEFFEEYVHEVLAQVPAELPPAHFKIGNTEVSWFQSEPGTAIINTASGTIEDRLLAETVVREQLRGHNIKQAQFNFDGSEELRKTASWDDIAAKAKRLIQSGNVQLLRNGYNNIVAQVQGDHGTYQSEIGRDDPDSRSITTWQCECLTPDSRIIMADGATKLVTAIKPGDLVLTATGRVQPVKRTMKRYYTGEIIGLKPTGFTEQIWVTKTHKLFTADYDPKEAGDWTDNDYSYYPQPIVNARNWTIDVLKIVGNEDYIEHEGRVYTRNKSYGSKRLARKVRPKTAHCLKYSSIPGKIAFDERFARLSGLYLAEGMVTDRGETRWSFDDDGSEDHLVKEVQQAAESYGLKHRMERCDHTKTVTVDSLPFSLIFKELFGTGSRTKLIKKRVLTLPNTILSAFMEAWIDGDGHRGNMKVRDSIGTANIDLAMQARYIHSRLGRETVHRRREDNSSPLVPGGKDFHTISWRNNGGRGQGRHFFAIDSVYQLMTTPISQEYSGFVYNLEVEDEHSYVIYPGIASANCPWDQYAWGRSRKWKRYEGRPCAHILSAYWSALAAPLDEDAHPQNQGPAPAGPSAPPSGMPAPGAPPPAPQGEQLQIPGMAPMQPPPEGPNVLPQFPMDPALQPQVNPVSLPGQKPPSPLNPIQYPGGTFSSWNFDGHNTSANISVVSAQPKSPVNGDMVSAKYDDWGIWQGRSDEHGAGSNAKVPAGSVGEVLGTDPTTGMINVLFTGKQSEQKGEMEPWGITAWFLPSELHARSDVRKPGPAVRRRK